MEKRMESRFPYYSTVQYSIWMCDVVCMCVGEIVGAGEDTSSSISSR